MHHVHTCRLRSCIDAPSGQGKVLGEDGSVGSTNFDGAIAQASNGVAAFFVAIVFAAGWTRIVRICETTSPVVRLAMRGEVVDLAAAHVHVTPRPVALTGI